MLSAIYSCNASMSVFMFVGTTATLCSMCVVFTGVTGDVVVGNSDVTDVVYSS